MAKHRIQLSLASLIVGSFVLAAFVGANVFGRTCQINDIGKLAAPWTGTIQVISRTSFGFPCDAAWREELTLTVRSPNCETGEVVITHPTLEPKFTWNAVGLMVNGGVWISFVLLAVVGTELLVRATTRAKVYEAKQ